MATIIKIKNLIVNFFANYFWGTVTGACLTSGLAAAFKLGDTMGNIGTYLQNEALKDMTFGIMKAFHTGITLYWDVMGIVDVWVLVVTIILLLFKGLMSPSFGRHKTGY